MDQFFTEAVQQNMRIHVKSYIVCLLTSADKVIKLYSVTNLKRKNKTIKTLAMRAIEVKAGGKN